NTILGPDARPSLREWLQTPNHDYTRMIWWPQPLVDSIPPKTPFNDRLKDTRLVVWQASRIAPVPGFTPQPYLEVQPLIESPGFIAWLEKVLGKAEADKLMEDIPEALAGTLYGLINLIGKLGTTIVPPLGFYQDIFNKY